MIYPTLRSILIGALLLLIVGIWHMQSTMIAISTDMMAVSPPVPAVFFLLLAILALNPLLGRLRASLRFSVGELVVVFAMVLVGTPLVGTAWAQALFPSRVAFRYYATQENRYQEDFFAYVKGWFGPSDPETVRGFFEGGFDRVPWLDWLPTILVWAVFSLVFYFTFIFLTALVRKQWIERERLSFPLLKMPMELLEGVRDGKHSFLKNRLTWIGLAIPVLLHTVNGLNAYFPGFPAITTDLDISRHLTEHPWSSMWGVSIAFRPMLLAIGYLMNLEIAFSCWFFFLFQKLMLVVSAAMAWGGSDSAMAGFPFNQEQESGAFFALALVYFWVLRRHFKESFAVAWLGKGSAEERKEAGHYRTAWAGLAASLLFIYGFAMAAGMSLGIAMVFFLVIFVHVFVLTRIRAEAGIPPVYSYEAPTAIINMPFGAVAVSRENHTAMAFFAWIMQDMRGVMMPNVLDSYKLQTESRAGLRGLALVFVVAIAVGIVVGSWSELVICYKYGANSLCEWRRMEGHKPFQQLSTLIQNPEPVKSHMPHLFVGVGFIVTLFFSYMRMRFLWWPFHPIGYAIGSLVPNWSMIFLGWLLRLAIFRLGGTKGYRRGLPFFLGLILGDFVMRVFWGVLASFIKGKGYLPLT